MNLHRSLSDRSFTVAGLHLWSSLPLHLRDSELTLRVPLVAADAFVTVVTAGLQCLINQHLQYITLHYYK